jgi:hypothetical protein
MDLECLDSLSDAALLSSRPLFGFNLLEKTHSTFLVPSTFLYVPLLNVFFPETGGKILEQMDMSFATMPPFVSDEAKGYNCLMVAGGFESDIVVPDPENMGKGRILGSHRFTTVDNIRQSRDCHNQCIIGYSQI